MDYIIILKDGNPLTFGGITIPNSNRAVIVVYGNKEEAEKDFSESEDLGIATLEYDYDVRSRKCQVKVNLYGEEIGWFTYDSYIENSESAFQEKLWDFIILNDFETRQLPH